MFLSQKLKYHVYLENIQIDFSNITISEHYGQVPHAIVSIVPIENIFNILPKTLCTITCEMPVRDNNGNIVIENSMQVYDEMVIFFGELIGHGLLRTAANAQIQLTFQGFTGNWDTSSITPTDTNIQTNANSVILGINAFDANTPTKGAFFYNTLLTPLISFVDLLRKKDDKNKTAEKVVQNIGLDVGRDRARTRLRSYRKLLLTQKSEVYNKAANSSEFGYPMETPPIPLKDALQKTIKHLLLNYGVFTHTMTKSLSLDTMINYVGSVIYEKLIKSNATAQFIQTGISERIGNTTPISHVLKEILPYINYTYTEFAAPIVCPDSSNIAEDTVSKILIHPDLSFLAPIANNVFFDDDIITAQFSRDFNSEPTRVVRVSNPIATVGGNDGKLPLFQLLLATVVPANIVVGTAIDQLSKITAANIKSYAAKANDQKIDVTEISDNAATETRISATSSLKNSKAIDIAQQQRYKEMQKAENGISAEAAAEDIKILKITNEEMMRGVVPQVIGDNNGVEMAFILAKNESAHTPDASLMEIFAKAQKAEDTGIPFMDGLKLAGSGNQTDLNIYSANLALLHYRELRRQGRSLSLSVVYSPFRVCGASSLIFIKNVGSIIGVLKQIETSISASGEVSQQLSFSHTSVLNVLNSVGTYADALDTFTDNLPPFEDEFTIGKVGERIYSYINGRRYDSSVNDFVQKVADSIITTTKDQADWLQKTYYNNKNLVDLETFLYKLTWRRLATKGDLMAVITNGVRKANTFVDNTTGPMPFVAERQDVINEIFSI
jgi:hypothetical protein